jgi:hypothetical protein
VSALCPFFPLACASPVYPCQVALYSPIAAPVVVSRADINRGHLVRGDSSGSGTGYLAKKAMCSQAKVSRPPVPR